MRNRGAEQPQNLGRLDHRDEPTSHGSYSFDDPDRPRWDRDTVLERAYHYHRADGSYAYTVLKGRRRDGLKAFLRGRRVQGTDDWQMARQEDELYRLEELRGYRKGAGSDADLLYRLPELIADMAMRPDDPVYICEGEKDVETLRALGLIATTNPNGALNWKSEFNEYLRDRNIVILVDNDDKGRQRAVRILASLRKTACP